jgi:DNA-binding response OmpR family regulator
MRILLVDDDLDLADAMATILRRDGHDVATAGTGSTALAIARSKQLEAVLLDLSLPDMDGFSIAHVLRDRVIAADTSIIVITGVTPPRLDAADEAGVDLVLSKPVASEHLGGLVEYITKRRHTRLRRLRAGPARRSSPARS